MKGSSIPSFTKSPSCPSSNMLLSLYGRRLSRDVTTLLRHHLEVCEFCRAELPLLAYYRAPVKGECKAPDLPINLRILAESILARGGRARNVRSGGRTSVNESRRSK